MSVEMAFQTLHVHIWQKAPLFSKYPLSTGIASSTHYEALAGVLGIVMHVERFIFFPLSFFVRHMTLTNIL